MQVRIFCGAQYAYACIKTETKTLDVRLSPGRSAAKSLQETVQEIREQAARLLDRAALIEAAERLLQEKNNAD